MLMNFPLVLKSSLHTQIALNTMEEEYIALSQSMLELIAIFELLGDIKKYTFEGTLEDPDINTHSTVFLPPS